MGDHFSKTELRPWPEWLPLAEAAQYARMSRDKLRLLVDAGKVVGYANPDFQRGPKNKSAGEWWVQRASIDAYHESLAGLGPVQAAILAHRRRVGL